MKALTVRPDTLERAASNVIRVTATIGTGSSMVLPAWNALVMVSSSVECANVEVGMQVLNVEFKILIV